MFGLNKKKNTTTRRKKKNVSYILDENSAFSVQEAYKTIRTNLIFSLPDKNCKKILLTSTTMHEYKSTTSINLALTLAESGYRVLLLDCDLRLTNVAETLDLQATPGISDYLVGLTDLKKVMQKFRNIDVITGGTVPPNPSELLGSDAMAELIKNLESKYDYIIIDSPPIGSVVDSLVLSPLITGFIFVVRNEVARKDDIDRCIKNMQIAGAKMLGFVYTAANTGRSKYYYRSYYKKDYYKR